MLAHALLLVEVVLVLSAWGPQPVAWLWVGSQVDYLSGSVMLGITCAFAGMLATLMLTLAAATQVDGAWRIVRRAAGHDQRDGALPRVFMWTAIVAGSGFLFWFFIIGGPGSTLMPGQAA